MPSGEVQIDPNAATVEEVLDDLPAQSKERDQETGSGDDQRENGDRDAPQLRYDHALKVLPMSDTAWDPTTSH